MFSEFSGAKNTALDWPTIQNELEMGGPDLIQWVRKA